MFAAILLIVVAILYRVVAAMSGADQNGWLPNFAPIAAIALCGAIYLPRRAAIVLSLSGVILSDIWLNVFHYHRDLFTWEILTRYVALGLIFALGFALRGRVTALRLFGASFVGSLVFYAITNTGSWISDPAYARTFAGWFQAVTVGRPEWSPTWVFYRNTLLSDLIFTGLFLICHTVTTRGTPKPEPALAEAHAR